MLKLSQKTLEKLIRELQGELTQEISKYEAETKRHKEELKRIEEDIAYLKSGVSASDEAHNIIALTVAALKPKSASLKSIMLDLLSDGVPRTSRQAYEHYKKITGKEKDFYDFSGMFSPVINAEGSLFAKYVVPQYPMSHRTWYCLKEWFEGNNLKPEYLAKIKAPDTVDA